MIDGVKVKRLKVIPDERGRLMEMLRCDDEIFEKFGQIYMTTVYPGVVKGWHYHRVQNDNFVIVKGMVKVALYDEREGSSTKGKINEFFLGGHNPTLLHIPRLVVHGFKGIGIEEAIVINCTTEPYNHNAPDEFRIDPHNNNIPYDWSRKDG
ncbi:MAG: dTDP-4-dehydrorhamnose 3,5-epimerase family protein [Nitrospinota bacterium]|jgi:dTDP-4-dehydrorhamnose 3,5-epimerase